MGVRREVVPKVPEEGQRSGKRPSGSERPVLKTIVGLPGRFMAGAPASKPAGAVTRFPVRIKGEDRFAGPITARDAAIARRRKGLAHRRDGISPGCLRQAETAV